ncbi:MAG: tRNA lysidine(34) synthetase TilS [Bacteroidales bacterium]|nr:tRNA lysidine(34) synthetase TilS [Bacteroidales bacterium]
MMSGFQSFIDKEGLCGKTDRILLGVSGGIDSVCMLHYFSTSGYSTGIAHCNFGLRGEESDQDEIFVRNLASEFDIPFFSVKFNTQEIAEKEGISIQMAARDLRYEWFEEIRKKYDYDYIAIAHNKDDVIETFLINLTRGSGLKGFTGIKPKSGKIIRPLLFSSRNDILTFICTNNLEFREDSSNNSVKYSRNLIRHELIPLFEKINPAFRETMIENISRLKESEEVYLDNIQSKKELIFKEENQKIIIDIEQLKLLHPLTTYLHEFLKPFGFSHTQISDIINSLDGISGKKFISLTHRLIKDRTELIIEEVSATHNRSFLINSKNDSIEHPVRLNITELKRSENYEISKDTNTGLFDSDFIEFPLTIRKWKSGDYFMPLGMKNLKKLSDFFIDEKLSISEKENTWILESENKIIWIIGKRIDDRFKITGKTTKILKINLI